MSLEQVTRFVQNTLKIASIHKYNTEREFVIEDFFISSLKNKKIFDNEFNFSDVTDFSKHHKILLEKERLNSNKKLISKQNFHYLIAKDVPLSIITEYVLKRYNYVSLAKEFSKVYGFNPISLLNLEHILKRIIISGFREAGANDTYAFNNKDEYADPSFLADPPKPNNEVVSKCLVLNFKIVKEMLLEEYAESFKRPFFSTNVDLSIGEIDKKKIIEKLSFEIDAVMKVLTIDVEDLIEESYDKNEEIIIRYPLIKINSDEVVIPFFDQLLRTTHLRIEKLISNNFKLLNIDDLEKGKLAEKILSAILNDFEHNNYLQNVNYHENGLSHESDGVIVFNKSLWVVEVKSHPILRNYWKNPLEKII